MIKRSKRERERYDTFRSLLLFFSSYDARRRLCRTHRSIRKVNTYHICMYWTLMSKAVHDLFWHSSISFWWWLHRCTIFYVNILWYTNNTHLSCNPVPVCVCPPHMHTNEDDCFENEIISNDDDNMDKQKQLVFFFSIPIKNEHMVLSSIVTCHTRDLTC